MTTSRLTVRVTALHALIGNTWGTRSVEYRQAGQLLGAVPRALSVMATVCPDGYPTSTPGAPDRGGSASSGASDKLGDIVARRERPTAAYAALSDAVGRAALAVALLERTDARRALNACIAITDDWHPVVDTKAIVKAQRCTAPAERADEPWVRPECTNVASPGRQGLCDACQMRAHRWVKAQRTEVA